ncbi:DUF5329 family protein [Motilimonas eburnea]|uniref:DUF5329 family protein n=1 Tax=Motilimonas eburnea TaxID=1737488 RepID=UPI001E55478F|nr:DUF5329 family protein [Motilimonas eburnea]MCE2572448.1 DUF5329 family protein [Motilimonas eburnea]
MNPLSTLFATLASLAIVASFQISAQSPLKQEITQLLLEFDKQQCQVLQSQAPLSSGDSKKLFKKQFKVYKQDINSTADFIRLAVSRHHQDEQPIYLSCNKLPHVLSEDWFNEQLVRYRLTKANKGNMF